MPRSLDNPINWSFAIGRAFGITIRIHFLFVLGAIVLLAQAFGENRDHGLAGWTDSLGSIALLFLIVLLHEFGHCFGCRRAGGTADEILLWPLGGLAMASPPHTPWANLVTVIAGPAVNLLFCFITAAILIGWSANVGAVPWNPFHPFIPLSYDGLEAWAVQRWLVFFFGLNFILLLFNLAPVFPLDGGRILQALLWPRIGYRDSMMLASGIGMIGAVGFGVIGIFSKSWLLFAIAFFGYITCWQQRQHLKAGMYDEGGAFGYDFSHGYSSFERSADRRPSFWQRRRARREHARRLRAQQEFETQRRHVDAILQKISRDGIESLTPKERRILQRETQRQASSGHPD